MLACALAVLLTCTLVVCSLWTCLRSLAVGEQVLNGDAIRLSKAFYPTETVR